MRRRDFLIRGTASLTLLSLSARSWAQQAKATGNIQYLVAAHSDVAAKTKEVPGQVEVDMPGEVRFLDLATGKIECIEVPIFAHVYDQVPKQDNLFIGAVKWTNSAAIVDLKTKKLVKLLKAPGDYRFFGHTCFSSDSKSVYISAHSDSLKQGGLCVYDTKDWKLQKVVSSGGLYPHECTAIPGDRIAVVNGHSYRDHRSSELVILKQADFSVEKKYLIPKMGHVQYFGDDQLLLAGYDKIQESNVVRLSLKNGAQINFHDAKGYPENNLIGEALSAIHLSTGIHAITVKDAHTFVIWDAAANVMQMRKYDTKVYALAEFNGELLMTEGFGQLHRFKLPTSANEPLQEVGAAVAFANGKHMRVVQA